jgi:hypothetical protein
MMRMLVSASPEKASKYDDASSSGFFEDEEENEVFVGSRPTKKCSIKKSHALLDRLGNLAGPSKKNKCTSVKKAHNLMDRLGALGHMKAPTPFKSSSSKKFKAEGKMNVEGIGCGGESKRTKVCAKQLRPFVMEKGDQNNKKAADDTRKSIETDDTETTLCPGSPLNLMR